MPLLLAVDDVLDECQIGLVKIVVVVSVSEDPELCVDEVFLVIVCGFGTA